jgi:hypothetical protein
MVTQYCRYCTDCTSLYNEPATDFVAFVCKTWRDYIDNRSQNNTVTYVQEKYTTVQYGSIEFGQRSCIGLNGSHCQ